MSRPDVQLGARPTLRSPAPLRMRRLAQAGFGACRPGGLRSRRRARLLELTQGFLKGLDAAGNDPYRTPPNAPRPQ